jgi:hypothetical protein
VAAKLFYLVMDDGHDMPTIMELKAPLLLELLVHEFFTNDFFPLPSSLLSNLTSMQCWFIQDVYLYTHTNNLILGMFSYYAM